MTATDLTGLGAADAAEHDDEQQLTDLEIILPEGGEVTVGGIRATVRRLKTREFLSLMRVITRGLGDGLGSIHLNTEDPEQMQADLLGVLMVAVPGAVAEFGEFLLTICEPVSTGERAQLAVALENPDPMETLDILGVLVLQEKDDLAALVGKARAWLSKMQTVFRKSGSTPG